MIREEAPSTVEVTMYAAGSNRPLVIPDKTPHAARSAESEGEFRIRARLTAMQIQDMKNDAAVALDAEEYERAAGLYTALLPYSSTDRTIPYNLATAHYRWGNYDLASRYFRMVVDENSRDEEAWLFLGHSEYKRGLRDDAHDAWRQVLRINPTNNLARRALGVYPG